MSLEVIDVVRARFVVHCCFLVRTDAGVVEIILLPLMLPRSATYHVPSGRASLPGPGDAFGALVLPRSATSHVPLGRVSLPGPGDALGLL